MKQEAQSKPLDASLRQLIGYNLRRVDLCIRSAFVSRIESLGLKPTSFSALSIICDNPDLSQSRLAEALSVKRSAMVLIVDELEHGGLIARHAVPGDRRSYALRATLKGMQVRDKAIAIAEQVENELLQSLTGQEKALLTQLFTRLEQSMIKTPAKKEKFK